MDTIKIKRQALTRRNITVFLENHKRGVYKHCPVGIAFLTMFYEVHERACPLWYETDYIKSVSTILDIQVDLPRFATVAEALGMSMKSG